MLEGGGMSRAELPTSLHAHRGVHRLQLSEHGPISNRLKGREESPRGHMKAGDREDRGACNMS